MMTRVPISGGKSPANTPEATDLVRPSTLSVLAKEAILIRIVAGQITAGQIVARDPVFDLEAIALTELWGRQRRRRLTFADYHCLGGVAGALDRYAEGVFAELAQRGLAERVRRVMLALVRSREGAAQATRRVVGYDRLARDWDVVEELARRRLLMIDD